MSVLIVGTLAFDTVETPFGKRENVLGGSAGYAATAASFHAPTRMVGIVGDDFPQTHLDFFAGRGIDLAGVIHGEGPSFRWSGSYQGDMNNAQTHLTELNILEAFDATLPQAYRDSQCVLLANIEPRLQLQVLDQLEQPRLVVADTMNFWIQNTPDDLKKVLGRIDVLSINDGEARMLSGENNLPRAAKKILSMGPSRLIIKRGEHGASLFSGSDYFSLPAYPTTDVIDPTGAGDCFAGGMLGYLANQTGDIHRFFRQGMTIGSILASFVVEDFSLDRFRSLALTEVYKRAQHLKTLMHIPHFDMPST